MTKLPEDLQKRIDQLAESQAERLTSTLVDADTRARHFKAGASAMHSLMLEELKPILKITDRALRQWKMYCEEGMQDDLENAERENIEAQELMNDLNNLIYLKARIEGR